MSRSFNRRPSPALVVALLALFVALGGGALAATGFIGSDGRVHGCVDTKGHLTLVKAGAKCGKGKSAIAWNQRGRRGIKGVQGIQGVPGPGAVSFDRQFDFPANGASEDFPFKGFSFYAVCATTPSAQATVGLRRTGGNGFYAWGTKAEDGGVPAHASVEDDLHGSAGLIRAQGASSAELDVVAESTAPGEAVKWTRFDLTVIRGTKCNVHAMVTPPSSVG